MWGWGRGGSTHENAGTGIEPVPHSPVLDQNRFARLDEIRQHFPASAVCRRVQLWCMVLHGVDLHLPRKLLRRTGEKGNHNSPPRDREAHAVGKIKEKYTYCCCISADLQACFV